ncbi:hypothetical protein ACQKDD_17360 [Planococcus kocurii]|uniref:hypothetical protein n=1 Tax=Planococcus kocurii TaxID=1374 RepID=UPI003D085848
MSSLILQSAIFNDSQKVSKWYIGPSDYEDYSDRTREFLSEFIRMQDSFPVFLTFEPYSDQAVKLEKLLNDNAISYTSRVEGIGSRMFPVFTITLKDVQDLQLVLEETFWMAAANQFFAFSFTDNCTYKLAMKKTIMRKEKPYMLPYFQMEENSTVITTWHDGQGFNLYTSNERYKTLERLISHLPTSTIVENE